MSQYGRSGFCLDAYIYAQMGLFGKKKQKEEHILDDILARTPENPDALREMENAESGGMWEVVDDQETGDQAFLDVTADDTIEVNEGPQNVAWAPMGDEQNMAQEAYPDDEVIEDTGAYGMDPSNSWDEMTSGDEETEPAAEASGEDGIEADGRTYEEPLAETYEETQAADDIMTETVNEETEMTPALSEDTQTVAASEEGVTLVTAPVEEESDLITDDLMNPVSPDETASDAVPKGPQFIEMIVDEDEEYDKKEPKPKPNIFKYIVIAMIIIIIAVVAAFMGRTYLLQTQLDQGRKLLEEERYDEATATFNQALKIFHNSADAYLGLTQAAIGRGDLTGALRILDEGIEITGSTNLEKSRENIVDQVFATYVLNDYMINILPGETHQLEMTNRSEDMYFDVSWSSDDPSVGTVDENGLVTAVRNGKATIIATVGNDTWGYKDITASLIVGVVVTYLEEAGCDYVEDASALPSPCFVYQLNKDGYRIYDGTLEIEQSDATYSLTKCEISDPDPDGYVTYDIIYTITVPTRFGIHADTYEAKHAWYYNWMATEMMLCDDYTGLVFAVQDLYGSDEVVYDSTVSWNGVDYHITGTTENEWVNNEEWGITYSPLTLVTWAEAPVIGTYHLNIKVPKEYQGLVLALDKKGTTDYTDPVYDEDEDGYIDSDIEFDATKSYVDTYFFDPLEDGTVRNADDFYIVRLMDFATEKGRAASVITE